MQPSIRAIIFDLDGVLADSEPWWNKIDAKLLAEYGATYHGDGTGIFTPGRVSLLSTASGKVYNANVDNCGIVPDMLPPNLVTSCGSLRGYVCFTVRASVIDSLVLFDNQSTDQDKLYFSLR